MENIDVLPTKEEMILKIISEKAKMTVEEISLEDTIESLFNKDLYSFSHALIDIMDFLKIEKIPYELNREFELFLTVEDVLNYFNKIFD